MAWILATSPDPDVRNVSEALAIATEAVDRTERRLPEALDVLAIVQAEKGQFDEAIQTTQQAIDLLDPTRQAQQLSQYRARLALYQTGGRVSEHRQR